jgi:hypothetical protein
VKGKMISIDLYLWIVTIITAFRAVMYIFKLDHVSAVKMTPEAWKDSGNKEMMHAYCHSILASSIFRLLVNLWAQFVLVDESSRKGFCWVSLALDVMFMLTLTGVVRAMLGRKHKVLIHQNRIPPLTLQSIVLGAGILCMLDIYVL